MQLISTKTRCLPRSHVYVLPQKRLVPHPTSSVPSNSSDVKAHLTYFIRHH